MLGMRGVRQWVGRFARDAPESGDGRLAHVIDCVSSLGPARPCQHRPQQRLSWEFLGLYVDRIWSPQSHLSDVDAHLSYASTIADGHAAQLHRVGGNHHSLFWIALVRTHVGSSTRLVRQKLGAWTMHIHRHPHDRCAPGPMHKNCQGTMERSPNSPLSSPLATTNSTTIIINRKQ